MKVITLEIKRLKFLFLLLIFVLSVLNISNPAMAGSENDLLKQRIEKLERELLELKTYMNEKAADNEKKVNDSAVTAAKPEKGFKIKPYGFIKLDASYDDSTVTNGNYLILVPSEGSVKNDDEFNITARESRVGMDVTAPGYNGWEIKGKVEINFYGDGPVVHESKGEPFLRHAFIEVKKDNMSFLAGQTTDVISPLNPKTLNYVVGYSAGNNAYRRPQLRVTHNCILSDGISLLSQFALARTSGVTNEDLDGGGQNDGEDSGFPTLQGRLGFTTKGFAGKKIVIGISGHYGVEEVDWESGEMDYATWSGNMDYLIPLSERFTLKGEVFTGENLDDYYGGALQGINTVTRNEISSTGLWAQLNYAANNKWQYNAGFGIDNPDFDDINAGMRDKNSFYYINTLINVMPMVTLGFEYTYWKTEYKGLPNGTSNRLQTSVIYSW